jgi:hypothetical protein
MIEDCIGTELLPWLEFTSGAPVMMSKVSPKTGAIGLEVV